MKKLLALFMAMLILLSLAACGEDSAPAATEPAATTPSNNSDNTSSGSTETENNLFSQGLLAVEKDGKWGYINEKGEMVIQPIYDRAVVFAANGLAGV